MLKNSLLLALTILLVGCEIIGFDPSKVTREQVVSAMDVIMAAPSYEVSVFSHIETEEMEITAKPLYKLEMFTSETVDIQHYYYFNKIMEGMKLAPVELYIDNKEQMVYYAMGLSSDVLWYKVDVQEAMESDSLAPMMSMINEQFSIISLIESLKEDVRNFSSYEFIEEVKDGEETYYKYGLHYNATTILETVFNHFNVNGDLGFESFLDFVTQLNLTSIMTLLEDVRVDVLLGGDNKTLHKVELDLVQIIDKLLILFDDEISELENQAGIDFDIAADYLKHIEFGLMFNQVGTLQEIVIPLDAHNGTLLPIEDLLSGMVNTY